MADGAAADVDGSLDGSLDGLVDLDAVRRWLVGLGVVDGPLELVGTLGGGTQNVLVRLRARGQDGGRDLVLRRGPRHLRPRTNDNLRREMRVLAALAGTDVPHARLVAACPDEDVIPGAAFYVMEAVDGYNPAVGLPDGAVASPQHRRRVCLSTVEALASIGRVDHERVGLGDLGRPEGFLERQVGRWRSELDSYSRLDGYPGAQIPGLDDVATWLDERRPQEWRPGILHGDFHLANVLCSEDTGDVVAVLDWEMATIGDPLLDLGGLLATWPLPGVPEILGPGVTPFAGVVGTDELVAHYATHSDRDLSAVDWYTVLACFKLGIVLEGTWARACAGLAPQDVGERLHASALDLFDRARVVIG